jgi:hypothetical protein
LCICAPITDLLQNLLFIYNFHINIYIHNISEKRSIWSALCMKYLQECFLPRPYNKQVSKLKIKTFFKLFCKIKMIMVPSFLCPNFIASLFFSRKSEEKSWPFSRLLPCSWLVSSVNWMWPGGSSLYFSTAVLLFIVMWTSKLYFYVWKILWFMYDHNNIIL